MNSTEMINYTLDLQYSYNMKLIVLGLLAIYSIFALWYYQEYKEEYLYQYYVKTISVVLSKIYLVILPLWIFFLSRNVTIDVLLRPMVIVYSIAGIIFIFSLFVLGGEKIKMFFTGEGFYRRK